MAVQDANFTTANDQDPSDGLPGAIFASAFESRVCIVC